jgi:hypothetical protein
MKMMAMMAAKIVSMGMLNISMDSVIASIGIMEVFMDRVKPP